MFNHRDTEAQRREGAKAQSRRTWAARSTGRVAPARSRGDEAWKADRQTPALADRPSKPRVAPTARPPGLGGLDETALPAITTSAVTPKDDTYSWNYGVREHLSF